MDFLYLAVNAQVDFTTKHLSEFIENLKNGNHVTVPEDAELITRFEMQKCTPDILITNYSMMEYMLLRPREKSIWDNTINWLKSDEKNKLLFVIDEAHMYRGSSGGEVALLIRRLFHKMGITRKRVQFILTTASMPQGEKEAIDKFARDLTAADEPIDLCYLEGEKKKIEEKGQNEIPFSKFTNADIEKIENEETRLSALNDF